LGLGDANVVNLLVTKSNIGDFEIVVIPETAAKRRMQILLAAHRAFNRDGINVSVEGRIGFRF
jgi:hypothetical protein